ncbi:hypothetical protein [Providencia rettgeri]|uniref:hypothetical protein n=1 Tax=Providencia rettgeri TaxID=587 RepID=UPI00244A9204|nr:hypothetical protein [Providencia rettgeri]MDH2379611.1 hypothetical protein [Providencia rettgeri]
MINLGRLIIIIHCLILSISIVVFANHTKIAIADSGVFFLITMLLTFISVGYTYRYYKCFKFKGLSIARYLNVMALLFLIGLVACSVIINEREHELQIILNLLLVSNIFLFLGLFLFGVNRVNATNKKLRFYNNLSLVTNFNDQRILENNCVSDKFERLNFNNQFFVVRDSLFDNVNCQIESYSGYDSSNNQLGQYNISFVNPASGLPMIDNIFDSHGNVYGTYDYDKMV